MEEDFWIWTAALESGFLPLNELVKWADEQILHREELPAWLMDLSLANSKVEALAALRQQEGWPGSGRYLSREWGDLHLGFLYLRHERGELSVAELLRLAGQHADGVDCDIDCETFYMLLNEINGCGLSSPPDEPPKERVATEFAPFTEIARRHLSKLPGA